MWESSVGVTAQPHKPTAQREQNPPSQGLARSINWIGAEEKALDSRDDQGFASRDWPWMLLWRWD